MLSLLFFLIAANNVIKVVRDALFLSYHSITELPYIYLSVAFFGGTIISLYIHYAARLPLRGFVLSSYALVISSAIAFWYLITFLDSGWVHYAFYIWSAIVVIVAVAQFWTLVSDRFTPREARRLFGILTAGGTLGGIAGSLSAKWTVYFLGDTGQLLWLIVVFFAGACGVVWLATREDRKPHTLANDADTPSTGAQAEDPKGILGLIRESRYLQGIAVVIFVSVIISTLIDFQFKAAAQEAYASRDALTAFFGSYYAWVNAATLLAQVLLTSKLLNLLGLFPSLFFLPLILLLGSLGILIWPGLLAPTATRLADAALRPSINRSALEILYFPMPMTVKKKIKAFLEVGMERLGDASAGFVILSYTLFPGSWDTANVHYLCVVLILLWAALIPALRRGYLTTLRASLEPRDLPPKRDKIDYTANQATEAVLRTLAGGDEKTVLFCLDLSERLDSRAVPHLHRNLLRHPSPAVRSRALRFFAHQPDPSVFREITSLLGDKDQLVQAEALDAIYAIKKEDAIPIIRPYLESPDPRVKRSAIVSLLDHGNPELCDVALTAFRKMVNDHSPEGEKDRLEAARVMGERDHPEFTAHLSRLIREDSSVPVIQEAIAAAAKKKYPALIKDLLPRLCCKHTKREAQAALREYGAVAVDELKRSLFSLEMSRDVRSNIPRTLSRIGSQSAMDALVAGLGLEDDPIRHKIMLALGEMAHRFPVLEVNREAVESAMISEAKWYYRRSVALFVLFDHGEKLSKEGAWLLRQALLESREQARERILNLLSLIYHSEDIQLVRAAVEMRDPARQAYGIELLDHLLVGSTKRDVFPVFHDLPRPQSLKKYLELLALVQYDPETALQDLLKDEDVWLRAAAIWEIGIRRLGKFRDDIQGFLNSDHSVLKEAAKAVIAKI